MKMRVNHKVKTKVTMRRLNARQRKKLKGKLKRKLKLELNKKLKPVLRRRSVGKKKNAERRRPPKEKSKCVWRRSKMKGRDSWNNRCKLKENKRSRLSRRGCNK